MAYATSLGARLRDLRLEWGYSQEFVAQALLVSRETIRNWENDQSEPSCAALKEFSVLYHVTTDYLLGVSDQSVLHLDRLSPEQAEVVTILVNVLGSRSQGAADH